MTDLMTIRDTFTEVLENVDLLNGTTTEPFNPDPDGVNIDFGFGINVSGLISFHVGSPQCS